MFAGRWTVGDLVRFHTAHKLLLMAHAPDGYRRLGRLVAGARGMPRRELDRCYVAGLMQTVASNLTPDTATGLPSRGYNEKTFVATMRSGKKPNGTAVMPPMPIEVYQNLTDDDLRSIWMYLATLKPIRNAILAGIPNPTAK